MCLNKGHPEMPAKGCCHEHHQRNLQQAYNTAWNTMSNAFYYTNSTTSATDTNDYWRIYSNRNSTWSGTGGTFNQWVRVKTQSYTP